MTCVNSVLFARIEICHLLGNSAAVSKRAQMALKLIVDPCKLRKKQATKLQLQRPSTDAAQCDWLTMRHSIQSLNLVRKRKSGNELLYRISTENSSGCISFILTVNFYYTTTLSGFHPRYERTTHDSSQRKKKYVSCYVTEQLTEPV